MNYLIKPYPHQEDIVARSMVHDNLGLLWEMGTGKTGGLINILRLKFGIEKRMMSTVIFTPLVTLYNWKEEFGKFSKIPLENIHVIDKSGPARIKLLKKAMCNHDGIFCLNNIIIINWECLQNKEVQELFHNWCPEIVVGDELHMIKSYKSKRAKAAIVVADRAKYVFGLTGTPILNSVADIFMQFRFLDGGKLFGDSYWVFQGRYMMDENAGWSSKPGHFTKYVARPEMYAELSKKMYTISTRITKAECLKDLPPLIKTRRHVPLGKEQMRLYKEMRDNFITFIKEKTQEGHPQAVVAQLAVTKALRLMQIVSGFVKTEDDVEIDIKDDQRIKITEELLAEITPNHKVIIWCSFKHNYKTLGKLCEKMKLDHVFITGDMNLQQKQEAMNEFRTRDETRVIIANRKAGGIGINLVEASYSIVFSRNFSLGEEKQSEARNHRGGSQIHERVTKIDLVSPGTIEELVLEALNNKQKISDAVVDWARQGEL